MDGRHGVGRSSVIIYTGIGHNLFVQPASSSLIACPGRVIFFSTLVPGSGNFQLSRLVGLVMG